MSRLKRRSRPCRDPVGVRRRVRGGRYVEVHIDRVRAARFGLSLADVQQVVALAIGGENVGETVEGLQRFPINMRYPRELRDSVRQAACATDRHRSGCNDDTGRRGRSRRHRWTTAVAQRKRKTQRLGLRRHQRPRSRRLRRAGAEARESARRVTARIYDYLVGAIRISGARGQETATRGAVHPGDHFRPALSHLRQVRCGCIDHGHVAVRVGRRLLAAVSAGLQPLDRLRDRLHCACRGRGGIRRHHADLPRSCDRQTTPGEPVPRPRGIDRSDRRGRGTAGTAEGDDGRSHHRRPVAHHVGRRNRFGGHATNRSPHGRRHDHVLDPFDARPRACCDFSSVGRRHRI